MTLKKLAMNLIIDIGNSAAKVALVRQGEIVALYCFADNFTENVLSVITPEVCSAIICSTRVEDEELTAAIRSRVSKVITLNHKTPTPIKNLYATPETLGMDRLAAAVGAWNLARGRELLIFDLGSAITIDFVSADGEFLGGNISPGVAMRFAALNRFTEKLPLIDYSKQPQNNEQRGTTTASAIWNGVVRGVEYEINGYIEQNPQAQIFFTGRDAKNFAKSAKNAIFADCELVIKGLDLILEYYAED